MKDKKLREIWQTYTERLATSVSASEFKRLVIQSEDNFVKDIKEWARKYGPNSKRKS